jgi:hypothetical protein
VICRWLRFPLPGRSNKLSWDADLLPLLDSFRELQASDPRDKVFAAFAILLTHVPALQIDYRLSTKELYQKVDFDAMDGTGNLDVLAYCVQASSDLPSWASDWRQRRGFRLLCVSYDTRGECTYHCSAKRVPQFRFSHAESKLTVRGIVVDKIRFFRPGEAVPTTKDVIRNGARW